MAVWDYGRRSACSSSLKKRRTRSVLQNLIYKKRENNCFSSHIFMCVCVWSSILIFLKNLSLNLKLTSSGRLTSQWTPRKHLGFQDRSREWHFCVFFLVTNSEPSSRVSEAGGGSPTVQVFTCLVPRQISTKKRQLCTWHWSNTRNA